ncbi:MarR family transcriptional regulator [Paenibacillus sp. HN-1]|uniref:MarR family winged helix-turn-helix transcriptional regulator n=1 Tax=Paenibacillus TaxID=44249 RepID=UPI001CA8930D|nr:MULTISPECIES: MarR family transcriptional regulator [Paenibacillus]MBY9077734.1 MarR family transcriptional regulator [Paenibacillus sp. CGMCC 1.18879]MBY9083687.1 MarR family transcriptional regulator [Paenibacillus sinensis]
MPEQINPLVEQIGLSMWRVQKRIISGIAMTAELGLTFPQFSLLNMIAREGRARVITLAERMEVKSSAVTVMLDRMESVGLVRREPDENDRRAVVVTLTEKGENVRNEGHRRSLVLLEEHLSILTPEELGEFARYYDLLDRQER